MKTIRNFVSKLKSGKRVLLIEDKPIFIEAVKKELENNGFEVLTARSIKQALSCLDLLEIEGADKMNVILLEKQKDF